MLLHVPVAELAKVCGWGTGWGVTGEDLSREAVKVPDVTMTTPRNNLISKLSHLQLIYSSKVINCATEGHMINEWQTLRCNNVYERGPLIRQGGQREWMARDSLVPSQPCPSQTPFFIFICTNRHMQPLIILPKYHISPLQTSWDGKKYSLEFYNIQLIHNKKAQQVTEYYLN